MVDIESCSTSGDQYQLNTLSAHAQQKQEVKVTTYC